MDEKKNSGRRIPTELLHKRHKRQIGRQLLFGVLFALLLSVSIIRGQVYADVPQGSGTVKTETVETAETTEPEEEALAETNIAATESEMKVETARSSVPKPILLFVVLLVIILAALYLFLRPGSGEKLEALFEEYNDVYETQHRYYAYCVEELNRADRLGTQHGIGGVENVRKDVGLIYNERIENNKRAESIKNGKMDTKTAVRSMKKILVVEKEHLRRLENHLRFLREENAKHTSNS